MAGRVENRGELFALPRAVAHGVLGGGDAQACSTVGDSQALVRLNTGSDKLIGLFVENSGVGPAVVKDFKIDNEHLLDRNPNFAESPEVREFLPTYFFQSGARVGLITIDPAKVEGYSSIPATDRVRSARDDRVLLGVRCLLEGVQQSNGPDLWIQPVPGKRYLRYEPMAEDLVGVRGVTAGDLP